MSDPLSPEQIERHTLEPNDLAALRMLAGERDWICQEDMRLHEVLPDDVYGAGTRALSRLRSRGLLRVITGADQGSSSRYADTYQINEAGLALLATLDHQRDQIIGEIEGLAGDYADSGRSYESADIARALNDFAGRLANPSPSAPLGEGFRSVAIKLGAIVARDIDQPGAKDALTELQQALYPDETGGVELMDSAANPKGENDE